MKHWTRHWAPQTRPTRLFLPLGLLLLVLSGCSSASDRHAFDDPAELQKAVFAFGGCVEESFPIVVSYRLEPFLGVTFDVGSQSEHDDIQSAIDGCDENLSFFEQVDRFTEDHGLDTEGQAVLAASFKDCVSANASQALLAELETANITTFGDASIFHDALVETNSILDDHDLYLVDDCMASTLRTHEFVFADGHDWFLL